MRMRHLALAAASIALAACSSGAPDEVVQGVAVYTVPATTLDVASLAPHTYFVDPSITIRANGEDQTPGNLNDAFYAPVKAAIDAGMQAAGYTPAADATGATVGLKLGIANATQDYYYSGGWCSPYYYWYGCYYPPVYAGSYTYGVGILGMVDLTAPQGGTEPFPNLWGAFVYGISTGATNTTRLADGIERAFNQSTYLAVP